MSLHRTRGVCSRRGVGIDRGTKDEGRRTRDEDSRSPSLSRAARMGFVNHCFWGVVRWLASGGQVVVRWFREYLEADTRSHPLHPEAA